MGAKVLTNIVQISIGVLIYVLCVFIFFRIYHKQNLVSYLKKMIKN